jgi:hypothetical protein
MLSTALIEPSVSGDAPDTQLGASGLPDNAGRLLAGLPPLLSVVPVAGPPVFVYVGFGAVLLLLLVPPLALVATLAGVALVVAAALVALVVLVAIIVKAPFLLVRHLRGRRLDHLSLPVPHVRKVRVRRA